MFFACTLWLVSSLGAVGSGVTMLRAGVLGHHPVPHSSSGAHSSGVWVSRGKIIVATLAPWFHFHRSPCSTSCAAPGVGSDVQGLVPRFLCDSRSVGLGFSARTGEHIPLGWAGEGSRAWEVWSKSTSKVLRCRSPDGSLWKSAWQYMRGARSRGQRQAGHSTL